MFISDIIRYQSRDVIYPVLKGSGFVKQWGVCYNVNGIHSTGNRWELLLIFCAVWNTQHGFPEVLELSFKPIKILLATRTSDKC
jgi:hypothetical protein